MAAGLCIRDLLASDYPAVRNLILAGLEEHWGELDLNFNSDVNDLARAYPTGRTIVVENLKHLLLGTGTLVPRSDDTAEIVRMSVSRSARRTGVGRALVGELLDTARKWGKSEVVLETTSTWLEVVAFYQSCGFRFVREVQGSFGLETWLAISL